MQFLHRMHMPQTYPAQAIEHAPELLKTWLKYSPSSQQADRDWEDWAENAAMLHAFDKQQDVLLLTTPTAAHYSGDNTPLYPLVNGELAFFWGRASHTLAYVDRELFPQHRLFGNHGDAVRAVQNYARTRIFQEAARRYVALTDHEDIIERIRHFQQAGKNKAFLKSRHKEFARAFDIPEGSTQTEIWNSLVEQFPEIEWWPVTHEGRANTLILQDHMPMRYEYRMVIIGSDVATGAGCIEAFTPVDNTGDDFDDRVEEHRNQGQIISAPDIMERYWDFAQRFAIEWAQEHGNDFAYTLDLALNPDDEVVAIEMNPFLNAGLYANNPDRIVNALLRIQDARAPEQKAL